MEPTIVMNARTARLIMGALSWCYSEGVSPNTDNDCEEVERQLVKQLYELYPDVVRTYSYIDSVCEVIKESKHVRESE